MHLSDYIAIIYILFSYTPKVGHLQRYVELLHPATCKKCMALAWLQMGRPA